jgi:hypothetical protein
LDAVLKHLKMFFGDDDQFAEASEAWTTKMSHLKAGEGSSAPIAWTPLLTSTRHTQGIRSQHNQEPVRNTERAVRENVPQAVHAGWSQKDKKRASEVTHFLGHHHA